MIDKLEMLIALARERHFGRAAEACHVTQPTLSSAIKSLEELMGVPLVRRGPRYQGLTPEGEQVLRRARSIVAEARAMRADIAAGRAMLTGTLRLGVIPTALVETRALTAPFLARHPEVRLAIRSMTSREIMDALADAEIDAGLSYAETDLSQDRLAGLETVPLYGERYALLTVAAPGLPLALEWAALGAWPLGLLTPDMQNRRIIDRNLAAAGVAVVPRIESNSILALVTHVAEAGIATVLPERIAVYFARQPELARIPILGAAEDHGPDVALLLPPAGRRSLLLDAFVTEAVDRDRLSTDGRSDLIRRPPGNR